MTRLDIDPRFAAAHYQDGRDLHGEQQPSVHSVAGDLHPLNAVRTGDEGAKEALLSEVLEDLRAAAPSTTVEPNSQEWAGMDGAIAWHLIERHADNWADVGLMMNEWLEANRQRTSVPPEVAGQRQSQDHPESCGSTQPAAVPAYQPMTDEEIATAWDRAVFGRDSLRDAISFARAIESAVLARVAAAPAAVQPVAQQQPSVHQVVGSGLPSQAVRTGGEGAPPQHAERAR